MNIQIGRSFSPFRESGEFQTDYEDWFRLPSGSRRALSWSDLLKKRLVVILGEAGIGKTYEFQNRVKTLAAEGKAAFFLPLNQLDVPNGFRQALVEQSDRYERWLKNDEAGRFFLDAVDEARLNSPVALDRAVLAIRQALGPHLKRVSLYISSRITDWSVPGVQDVVRQHLLKPLIPAAAADTLIGAPTVKAVEIEKPAAAAATDLEVFTLDPLSVEDAKKLAQAFGATPIDAFWRQVEEGDYEFLATRPLDLQWLAARWKQTQALGTYSELLEAAVTHRLTETNQSYVASKAVLSRAQLREGAEQLAAACAFSGRAYVQIGERGPDPGTVAPADTLPHWDALEHLRLLGAAVFDEATYGRVKFHHRAVREYLAACWVEKQIAAGLPVTHAMSLFVRFPYRQPVLLKSRRSVLCWLAALNAKVRQRVIRLYPEMLMFEGDPQRWSTEDVIEAFEGYIGRLQAGYNPDWWSFGSEIRRVARMLPPQVLAEYLSRYAKKPEVFTRLLTLVRHGRVEDCADIVFSVYRDVSSSDEERHLALIALSAVSTFAHRTAIADDLLSGKLKSNELVAAGLEVVGVESLDVGQLAKVFANTGPEDEFGGGRMARTLKGHLLPYLSYEATLKLLSGLLTALPTRDIREFSRRAKGGRSRERWILTIIPDVLLRALQLMNSFRADAPPTLTDASLIVEALRHTSYANNEDFRELRAEIEKHAEFRKSLALRIALSKDAPYAASCPIWMSGLIHFSRPDLDWLIHESLREDLDQPTRQVWYEITRDLAFMSLRGGQRRQVLASLATGVDAALRSSDIATMRKRQIDGLRNNRGWKREDRVRKEGQRRQMEENKAELLMELDGIRSGASFNAIRWLVAYAAERGSQGSYTKISTAPVYRDFGPELGDAFSEGLAKVWRQIDIPNPMDYLDNRIPWAGLVGLASVSHSFANGLEFASLSPDDVARAVKLNVWEIEKPEPWFDQLVEVRGDQAAAALMPWLEFEIALAEEAPILHTVELTLRAPFALKGVFLRRALEFLREGKVPRKQLQRILCRELIDAGLVGKVLIQEIALRHLFPCTKADPPTFASEWFADWAAIDFPAAWRWIEEHSSILAGEPAQVAAMVAEALKDAPWTKGLSGTVEEIESLVALFRCLSAAMSKTADDSAQDLEQRSSLRMLRDRIPRILAGQRGGSAQKALQALAAENAGTPLARLLFSEAREHASAEAELGGVILPVHLQQVGEVYTRDPRTEGDLYDQVVARLEEIREGVEEGPFSDRVLFAPKMEEKHLQIWLAARLDDTPRRRFIPRFSVTREPQVDDDKQTDIEVSCAAGKVCIEIKPLDSSRGYSANSLADTLKDQLVGKYLKGRNSKHGVLVLFRLDDKVWQIPDGPNDAGFEDLVSYLKAQATQIKAQNDKVERLEVFGIDCLGD